jgi:hypothetical protein
LKGTCLLATKSDINNLIATTSVAYALVCKDALISIHDMQHSLPPTVANILQEYSDVFPSEILAGLPPIRGIEHQIDLIPGASLPNRGPYRTNPEETKEIQRQVQELLDKGYVHESLSPCAVLVILVPRKMERGVCVSIVELLTISQFDIDILFHVWMICLMN